MPRRENPYEPPRESSLEKRTILLHPGNFHGTFFSSTELHKADWNEELNNLAENSQWKSLSVTTLYTGDIEIVVTLDDNSESRRLISHKEFKRLCPNVKLQPAEVSFVDQIRLFRELLGKWITKN